jgi:hypothetical protein
MPVMGNRMHLSKRIDLISKIRAVGFVEPALDPRNVGVNAARGVGDEVSNAAIEGACAVRAAESKGDNVGGVPQLELHAMCPVDGKGGVEDNGALRKCTRPDNQLMFLLRGVFAKVN